MPLHAYECRDCEASFEKLVMNGRPVEIQCTGCESTRVDRVMSIPAKPLAAAAATNCAGTGPPCGASYCGRNG